MSESSIVKVRITKDALALVRVAAEASGLKLSPYIRAAAIRAAQSDSKCEAGQ